MWNTADNKSDAGGVCGSEVLWKMQSQNMACRGQTVGKFKAKPERETSTGNVMFLLCLPGSGYKGFWVYIPRYSWLMMASEGIGECEKH